MNFLSNILLIFLSAFFTFLSHPNFIFSDGLSFFSWFNLVPFLYLLKKNNLRNCVLSGTVYGFLSSFFVCNWLITYNFWAGFFVYILFAFYWAVLSFLLKFSFKIKYHYLLIVLLLVVQEIISVKGYLGFGYCVSVYSQWNNSFFLSAASRFGIWIGSLLLISVNVFIFKIIEVFLEKKFETSFTELSISLMVPGFFFCLMLFCSLYPCKHQESENSLKVLLIQNNADPWQEGIDEYIREVEELKNLTDEALREYPETDLVVWPETAVVVDVLKYIDKSESQKRHKLAKDLFEYFESKDAVFITGNNHDDYNCALLVKKDSENKILTDLYRKNHLVPFSEDFPLKKILRPVYIKMIESGNVFWKKGNGINLLEFRAENFNELIKAGTPVCFEDTFSEIPAMMKKQGANIIVNLSNDSWSNSLACQKQHLAIACFRCAETGLWAVRATNSGQTCAINSSGEVLKELAPFTKSHLYCEVKLNNIK